MTSKMSIAKKLVALSILIVIFWGCGLIPAYRRSQSDYLKASSMMLHGGTKKMVRSDWGEPTKVENFEDGSEVWIYENREDGRTFIFYFDDRGKLFQIKS